MSEEGDELGVLEVELAALAGKLPPIVLGIGAAAKTGFFGIHEADGGEYECAYVPGGGPAFLVVVGEGGADGEVGVEATGRGVEDEFGCCEGVVLM